jgi:hypothetical protein
MDAPACPLCGKRHWSRQACPIEKPAREAQDESYDAADDFGRSLDACYAAVRARVAAGGEGWKPR